ncbi:MAG: hypothetical protein EB084_12870, partial [Proteobacteria bacterium]|nr:hypothetical protein [Pseudomonadota bacterium]
VPHGVVVDTHRAPPFVQLRVTVPHGLVVDLGVSPTCVSGVPRDSQALAARGAYPAVTSSLSQRVSSAPVNDLPR